MTRPQALSSGRNSWGPLPMTPRCIGSPVSLGKPHQPCKAAVLHAYGWCQLWCGVITGGQRPDISGYHQCMSDVLIRDLPDDVLAGIDARAAEVGLSRVEYIRRRLAQDARVTRSAVTRDDLQRLEQAVSGLADAELMRGAWG